MSSLAIILPIYKPDFLREALDSLAAQTCLDFTAYICDDCSPYDLEPIVKQYEGRFPFSYTRFADNLGGKDLVSHWERCLDQTQGEPWLWIFSDDDVLDPNCVASFYQQQAKYPQQPLFHFATQVIDSKGQPVTDPRFIKEPFPMHLSAEEFLRGRLAYRYNSFIVEYIFSREHFLRQGGFVHYDLAWCSDDATWFRLAQPHGIITIPSAQVHWRKSDVNITPSRSRAIGRRKLRATIAHLRNCAKWLPDSTMLRFKYFLHALYHAI